MTLIEELEEAMYAYDNSCDLYEGMYIGLQEAIDIVKAHNDWKPASQPPEEDGTYLVQTKFNNYEVLDYHNCCNRWEDDDAHERRCVVAWQPLPPQYKGERNDVN